MILYRVFGKKAYIILGILCCMFMWLQMGIESFAFTRTTGEVTGSATRSDILAEDGLSVVIIKANTNVKVGGNICYVSSENVTVTDKDGIKPNAKVTILVRPYSFLISSTIQFHPPCP